MIITIIIVIFITTSIISITIITIISVISVIRGMGNRECRCGSVMTIDGGDGAWANVGIAVVAD